MDIANLTTRLRTEIGDNYTDPQDQNITDQEYNVILTNSASEYSRIKSYLKIDETNVYDPKQNVYSIPADCLRVKSVVLTGYNLPIPFLDNIDQVILLMTPDIAGEKLKITYARFFQVTEILDKEIPIFMLYAEALCYKLLSVKTAPLIKFTTGEKSVDESLTSDKYRKLYIDAEKAFRYKAIKAYGKKAEFPKENLNYSLPYPIEGENL